MPKVAEATESAASPATNWRRRETYRTQRKIIARRVSDDVHELLSDYAAHQGTSVAELLAPAIDQLVKQALEHRQAVAS